ncbi:MAG: response regulator transcription factor [Candidatus Acidiferrales bacterium]
MNKHKTIVIIEDDPQLQQELTVAFFEAGFTVNSAYDGEEAVNLVSAKKPDVVLLDLVLPKKDGYKVLRELKGNPITKDIPVIILSNLESLDNVEYALRLGASSYLAKANYQPKGIVKRIEGMLAPPCKPSAETRGEEVAGPSQ